MMRSNEHYDEAKRLLAEADKLARSVHPMSMNTERRKRSQVQPLIDEMIARAQVHATLALRVDRADVLPLGPVTR